MTKYLLAALATLPLLAAPALAVTGIPKVKVPPAQECKGEVAADCAKIIQVPIRRG